MPAGDRAAVKIRPDQRMPGECHDYSHLNMIGSNRKAQCRLILSILRETIAMLCYLFLMVAAVGAEPAAEATAVRVKVLYGTDDAGQKAEIEEWISKEVSKAGSPIAAPYTKWIELTGEEQELYASMMGGRIIWGKVTRKDGKHLVEIRGFKIGDMKRTIALADGERMVLKLTGYPGAGNVFLAISTANAK
jgi:hypothetical protein